MRNPLSRLCVATVTYESQGVIGGWLDRIAALGGDLQVVVIDNASTDDSAVVAGGHPVGATVVDAGGNVGFGRGCNLAATHTDREFVWFLNPDARVESIDLPELERVMARPSMGLLETGHQETDGSIAFDEFQDRSPRGEWLTHVVTPLWPRALGTAPGRMRTGTDWASGASLLVRSDEFERLGGFDPSYFLLYEDRDLSFRARRAGMDIGTTAAILTTHTPGGSSAVEGLGVARRAWALLSWIEFAHVCWGEERAVRIARDVVRDMTLCSRLGASLGEGKVGERLRAAGAVLDAAQGFLEARGDEGYYTRAERCLRKAKEER